MTSDHGLSAFEQSGESVDKKKETAKKSKKKTVRGNIFEVCEDLEAFDTVPDFSICADSTGAVQYMWLVHDHDTYSEEDLKALKSKGLDMTNYQLGASKNDHVHVFMRFKNPVTLPKIAKAFGVPEQNVQRWTGANAWGNAVSYLTHRSTGAEGKYQYDPTDVHANFDYVQKLENVTQKVAIAEAKSLKKEVNAKFGHLKDLYKTGQISFTDLKRRISSDSMVMDLAAKQKRDLDALHELVDGQEIDKFFKTFSQPLRVIWLYGDTGCGKSLAAKYMAKHFARKRFPDEPPLNNSYQVLGSSRGPFEKYSSSVHCVILDDFRSSKAFTVDDLFRNFDPNHDGPTSLPCRYYDRDLAAGMIIITSRYNPAEFSYRSQGAWNVVQTERYKLMQDGQYEEDSYIDEYGFDDIVSMYVSGDSPDSSGYLEKDRDFDDMLEYYNKDFKDVINFTIKKTPQKIDLSEIGKIDAIKKAQLMAQLKPRMVTLDGPKAIKNRYRFASWNTCDSPSQILRRLTVYQVSRGTDDAVLFQRMRPIEHDNGYCEYEEDSSDSRLSLEEVWECKSLDFNPNNPSPYNYNSSDFNLDYEDQTLSEEVDFMLRCRKNYLYIHSGAQSRYLDEYHDPVIEVKEEYDEQALTAVLKKVREQVDAM